MFATIAFVFFGISYFMRAGYTADASFADYMMPLLVQGVAMSTFFVALLSILLEGVPDSQIPAASGLSNFLRITAGSFATSIVTTTWDRRAVLHQSRLAEASSVYDPSLQHAMTTLQRSEEHTSELQSLMRISY